LNGGGTKGGIATEHGLWPYWWLPLPYLERRKLPPPPPPKSATAGDINE